MAEPIGIASGLIGIIGATVQSTKALYQTVQDFRDHPRNVRQLRDELESLDGVLRSLATFAGDDELFFAPLKLPLSQCCQACSEFRTLVLKCTTHSNGAKPSFRDWARLRYLDNDVRGFTDMLAGYKSTISVALADANLTVTRQVLHEYKAMIRATTQDLEVHLEEINSKLQSLAPYDTSRSALTPADIQRYKKEQDSTKKCLEICARGLAHIDDLRLQPIPNMEQTDGYATTLSTQSLTFADVMTLLALKECSETLNEVLLRLRANEAQAARHLLAGGAAGVDTTTPSSEGEFHRLVRESDSTKQCLAVLSGASERVSSNAIHVVEDVKVGRDGQQMLITSRDQLFEARRVTVGDGATQVVMSSSDATLQEFFRAQLRR